MGFLIYANNFWNCTHMYVPIQCYGCLCSLQWQSQIFYIGSHICSNVENEFHAWRICCSMSSSNFFHFLYQRWNTLLVHGKLTIQDANADSNNYGHKAIIVAEYLPIVKITDNTDWQIPTYTDIQWWYGLWVLSTTYFGVILWSYITKAFAQRHIYEQM